MKSYFSRHQFTKTPSEPIDCPIVGPLVPVTNEAAAQVLRAELEKADKFGQLDAVSITLWVQNDDGTQEQIAVPAFTY